MVCIGCCPIIGSFSIFLLSGHSKRIELILRYDLLLIIKGNVCYKAVKDNPPCLLLDKFILRIDYCCIYYLNSLRKCYDRVLLWQCI